MLHVFSGLKTWFKTRRSTTDGPVFRLHYGFTTAMLAAFTAVLATRQYVGNPIDCVHTKDIDEDVLNTFCWIHSTYTMRSAFRKDIPHIYPGVGTAHWGRPNEEEDIKFYPYYQWVVFCLFLQVCTLTSNYFLNFLLESWRVRIACPSVFFRIPVHLRE